MFLPALRIHLSCSRGVECSYLLFVYILLTLEARFFLRRHLPVLRLQPSHSRGGILVCSSSTSSLLSRRRLFSQILSPFFVHTSSSGRSHQYFSRRWLRRGKIIFHFPKEDGIRDFSRGKVEKVKAGASLVYSRDERHFSEVIMYKVVPSCATPETTKHTAQVQKQGKRTKMRSCKTLD